MNAKRVIALIAALAIPVLYIITIILFMIGNDYANLFLDVYKRQAIATPANTSDHGRLLPITPSTTIFIRVACGAGNSVEP